MTNRIRESATVVVARPLGERRGGFEIFMVRRPARGAFPNLRVFPGGKVDPADDTLAAHCHALSDAAASRALGLGSGGLRYWVASIRECFEECGVLFAYRDDLLFRAKDAGEAVRLRAHQHALATGALSLRDFIAREKLRLATDRLFYFSHWITPPTAPMRFDTRFFLAALPPDQTAHEDGAEAADGEWTTPAQALANHADGRWEMIPPTLTTLRTLAGHADIERLFAAVTLGLHQDDADAGLRAEGLQPSPHA